MQWKVRDIHTHTQTHKPSADTHGGSNTKTSDRKTCTLMGMKFTPRVVLICVCVCVCVCMRMWVVVRAWHPLPALQMIDLSSFFLQHPYIPVSFPLSPSLSLSLCPFLISCKFELLSRPIKLATLARRCDPLQLAVTRVFRALYRLR